jgi:hypothetical protein
LVENGKDVAVIEYHYNDDYQNSYSLARINYYNVTGYPTVKFDGILSSVGGGQDMYPAYLGLYNQRINIMSDYTIEVTGTNSGLIDYEVTINVEKVGTGSITNPRLQVAITETDIPEFWGGLSEVNYVERLMVPNQNGTALDFSATSSQEVELSFSLDPEWINEKCAIVVFVQNNTTKEIYQGVDFYLLEFLTTNTVDAAILNVNTPTAVCSGTFSPKVEIANYGLNNLTSLEINYQVNNGSSLTYNWTGNLAFMGKEMVELPEITFGIQASNSLTVTIDNPNGSSDQYPSNNSISASFQEAMQVEQTIMLILKPDDKPEETSWELLDSQNNVLYSGGDYTSSSPVFMTFELTNTDCYRFKIYDEGGDGIASPGYKLKSGTVFFAQGTSFGYEEEVQFSVEVTGIEEEMLAEGFSVYPNPVTDLANVSFVMETPQEAFLRVYDMMGKVVLQTEAEHYSAGQQLIPFERKSLEAGIYFFSLVAGEAQHTKKVILK